MSAQIDAATAVYRLDRIDASDPEVAHSDADNVLLDALPAEVRAAYGRLVRRAPWWACA